MKFVVDANILVGLLLRLASQALLADPRLDLYIADVVWGETERHLRRRLERMREYRALSASVAQGLLHEALSRGRQHVAIVPANSYRDEEASARLRMPHDLTDWPTIAVALSIGGDIWTDDRHFHGCGIGCWTTETLLRRLGSLPVQQP